MENSDNLVSIIIPVYNVERYLERCVHSVLNQTYTNLEVILVNDGSSDSSPAICDAFAKEDSRIRVIHQNNKGDGAARNAGLDIFQGEWVCFVDSDDWVEPNYVEVLVDIATKNNTLLAVCRMRRVLDEPAPIVQDKSERLLNFRQSYFYIFDNRFAKNLPGFSVYSANDKLFNRKLFATNRFTTYRYGEDAASVLTFVHFCEELNSKISVTNQCLYNYFQGSISITRGETRSDYLDIIDAFQVALKYLKYKDEQEVYELFWRDYFSFCIDIVCVFSRDLPEFSDAIENTKKLIKEELQYAYKLSHKSITFSFGTKTVWNGLLTGSKKYILYGLGAHGKKFADWLLHFDIPLLEIWDARATDIQKYKDLLVKTMHNGFKDENVTILCSIESMEVHYEIHNALRELGYADILPFETLQGVLNYAAYRKYLPFIFEMPL